MTSTAKCQGLHMFSAFSGPSIFSKNTIIKLWPFQSDHQVSQYRVSGFILAILRHLLWESSSHRSRPNLPAAAAEYHDTNAATLVQPAFWLYRFKWYLYIIYSWHLDGCGMFEQVTEADPDLFVQIVLLGIQCQYFWMFVHPWFMIHQSNCNHAISHHFWNVFESSTFEFGLTFWGSCRLRSNSAWDPHSAGQIGPSSFAANVHPMEYGTMSRCFMFIHGHPGSCGLVHQVTWWITTQTSQIYVFLSCRNSSHQASIWSICLDELPRQGCTSTWHGAHPALSNVRVPVVYTSRCVIFCQIVQECTTMLVTKAGFFQLEFPLL